MGSSVAEVRMIRTSVTESAHYNKSVLQAEKERRGRGKDYGHVIAALPEGATTFGDRVNEGTNDINQVSKEKAIILFYD